MSRPRPTRAPQPCDPAEPDEAAPDPVPNPAPDPFPGLTTRADAEAALALIAAHGAGARREARTRAAAALRRDNPWAHARWREVDRLLAVLSGPAGAVH